MELRIAQARATKDMDLTYFKRASDANERIDSTRTPSTCSSQFK